ncbi:MAG: NADH:flavin oxidoreductase [Bacteroidetes bacterium]|nr:NADH:flavin oxidoreductase [Bacteroidota bacterium]
MIFEPSETRTIKLRNRIIRSATHEGLADEHGYPTDKLLKTYEVLARNEVGCIITGFAGIMQNGRSNSHNMLMIDNDSFIDSYRRITEKMHELHTPVILQIAHCGRQTRSKITGLPTVAPSALRDTSYNEDIPKELSEQEISEITDGFANATLRAKKAGFDGVQLHLAHGYLLAQFLSSYTNRRTDQWGGSTGNKFRIIAEIFRKAKHLAGDFPIWVKMNAHDGRKGGMTLTEAVEIAKMLEHAGCAAIEVSCGVFEDGLYTVRGEKIPVDAAFKYNFRYKSLPGIVHGIAKLTVPLFSKKIKPYDDYNVDHAAEIRKNVKIPVIVVGGIRSVDSIKAIIAEGKADYVSMCRPFIIEPNIARKFKEGSQAESKCIRCNYCAIGSEENALRCYNGKLK